MLCWLSIMVYKQLIICSVKIVIVVIIIFISRFPEKHKPIDLATIKQQNSRKITVRTKNTKSKKKIKNTTNATRPKPNPLWFLFIASFFISCGKSQYQLFMPYENYSACTVSRL